jgi:pimeloyl-CoA synthetase
MEKTLFEQLKEARTELVKKQNEEGTNPSFNNINYEKIAELCLSAVKKNASSLQITDKKRFQNSLIQKLKDNGITVNEKEERNNKGEIVHTLILSWDL